MESRVNLRNLVLNMLSETLEKGALSSFVLSKNLNNKALSERDRAFIENLYLGVLERLYFLDYNIGAYSNVPFNKIKPVVKNILRTALYQMYFMDAVPERAAVSEALKLADLRKTGNLKGFINGILRMIQREGLKEEVPDHVKACVPEWLYEKICSDIGKDEAGIFFAAALKKEDTLTASLNTSIASKDEIIKSLKEDGCFENYDETSGVCEIRPGRRLSDIKAFKDGYIYIQGANSMQAAKAAKRYCKKNDPFIIDVCASPGGKSINLANYFPDAAILSRDKSEEKVRLINENISRLRISNMTSQVYDACVFDRGFEGKADIVIADLPCSGMGVISGKPDIRHRLKKEDISSLSNLQREILKTCSGYVKAGGILIYSTCTLTKEENEENAGWFARNFDFTTLRSRQYTLYKERADGFYVAAFSKN